MNAGTSPTPSRICRSGCSHCRAETGLWVAANIKSATADQSRASVVMPKPVADSVTVITGASRCIGRATALRFARAGGTVVVAGRRREALESLAAECRRLGGRALPFALDVADQAAVEHLARITHEEFGRL